jgi:hypothetical protein
VRIADNLLEWLANHRKCKGPVAPERIIDVLSERLRKLAEKAGIHPWPHNAMSQSCGSYFLGKTKDENLIGAEMGNSPGVVFRHSRAVAKDAAVAEYWSITPGNFEQQ